MLKFMIAKKIFNMAFNWLAGYYFITKLAAWYITGLHCNKKTLEWYSSSRWKGWLLTRDLGASKVEDHMDGLVQICSNSIANALELLQSCTKPSILLWMGQPQHMEHQTKCADTYMYGAQQHHCSNIYINNQGSFRLRTQPMRDGVTL